MAQLNKQPRYLSEIFDDANKSSDPVASLQQAIKEEVRLPAILGYAINPKWNMSTVVPPGEFPEFKPSELPLGMNGLDVLKLHNKFYILFNPALKQFKKEEFVIKWAEAMHPTDVKIFAAVKDQNLESLYPNLTKTVVHTALGWTPEQFKSLFV